MFLLLILIALSISQVSGFTINPDAHLGYQGERGVIARGLAGAGVRLKSNTGLEFAGALNLSLFQHQGITAYALSGEAELPGLERLKVKLGLQHEQWNEWRNGENRIFATSTFILPQPGLVIGLGICRRYPVYDSTSFTRPWVWHSPVPEWNIIYHLEWRFLSKPHFNVGVGLKNLHDLTFYNPQQFPFYINASYRLLPCWRLSARVMTAVNGFSTALASITGIETEIGVRYER